MAEAEDVITDAARHATVYAQALWRRHRPQRPGAPVLALADVAERLDLLVSAALGQGLRLRTAQPPAPPTFLERLRHHEPPPQREPLPAHDGTQVWLPGQLDAPTGAHAALERYRTLALLQALRAQRLGGNTPVHTAPPLVHTLFELLEAHAADRELLLRLPGLAPALTRLRAQALASRPAVAAHGPGPELLDRLARALLEGLPGQPVPLALALPLDGPVDLQGWLLELPASPHRVLARAQALAARFPLPGGHAPRRWLWRDTWLGELRAPADGSRTERAASADGPGAPPRSARLPRRPDARAPAEDEDGGPPGAWMVQTAQPHEQAEDPLGLQRPTDRDAATAAEDFADALSELAQARLVAVPGTPKEVLLSDDPPDARARQAGPPATAHAGAALLQYPEWDWRAQAYRRPGATVHLAEAAPGPPQWLEDTLAARRGMLHEVRRRFELLRARRVQVRRQWDGSDIDLAAWVQARADFRAGLPLDARLYLSERRARPDLAVLLLVDVSGSTDGWIAPGRRVVDVEREALLLVSIALDGMGAPFAIQAFSGEGPESVVLRRVKDFDQGYGAAVGLRIAGLEPEHYTRAGAALRHATATLLRQPAEHRLLLLLSDGKPNDIDDYEGRYGVEDLRQAVTEARLQGIAPFCLTVDRQAAGYLPAVFGAHRYALLPRPELLPEVLLDWLRRLVMH